MYYNVRFNKKIKPVAQIEFEFLSLPLFVKSEIQNAKEGKNKLSILTFIWLYDEVFFVVVGRATGERHSYMKNPQRCFGKDAEELKKKKKNTGNNVMKENLRKTVRS